MSKLAIKAFAKVNLALDVLRKTESGYHEIQTVLHEIPELFDVIEFEPGGTTCAFWSSSEELLDDQSNTIFKAVQLFEKAFNVQITGHLSLQKNIPIRAGLGGGSSDGAAALKLFAKHYKIPPEKLFPLAEQIGMDVPFFINGGTQLATHFGEVLTPLPSAHHLIRCEVVSVGHKESTAAAYARLDPALCGARTDMTDRLIHALKTGNALGVLSNLHNDFDPQSPNPDQFLAGAGGARVRITQISDGLSESVQA